MAQYRSVYKEILRNFLDSLKPMHWKYKFVGKDHSGTEYYESLQSPHKKRTNRWFTPVKSDDFEQDIPPEWDAWLRHRRKDPPTEEEIQMNLAKMKQTIENANKLKKPPTVSTEEVKLFEKPSFPKYDDFQMGPDCKERKRP